MSSLRLEVNGQEYDGFTDISVFKSMETLVGTFSFGTTTDRKLSYPFRKGDPSRVMVEGIAVITGYIDGFRFSYSANAHDILVFGRDKTSDIADNTIKGNMFFNTPVSLENIIRLATAATGINIPIINNAGSIAEFAKSELIAGKTGQNMFDYLEQHLQQRQVFMTTDGNGNISLIRGGDQELLPVALINSINEPNVNILSAISNDNDENRYNRYQIKSQGNPTSGLDDADLTGKVGTAYDEAIRSTRFFEKEAKTRSDVQTVEDRAKWEANIKRTRGFEYSCTVRGYENSPGVIWEPNKLVRVKDDFAEVDSTLLIKDVEYNLSPTGGSTTTLTMVNKDAFTLIASQNAVEALFNKTGLPGLT